MRRLDGYVKLLQAFDMVVQYVLQHAYVLFRVSKFTAGEENLERTAARAREAGSSRIRREFVTEINGRPQIWEVQCDGPPARAYVSHHKPVQRRPIRPLRQEVVVMYSNEVEDDCKNLSRKLVCRRLEVARAQQGFL